MVFDGSQQFESIEEVLHVVKAVGFKNEFGRCVVVIRPVFVKRFEGCQVAPCDFLFVVSPALPNALAQRLERAAKINHEVGRPKLGSQGLVKVLVAFPIPVVDVAGLVKMRCENFGIFVDRSILDDGSGLGCYAAINLSVNLESPNEKPQLGIVSPTLHVAVEVLQIRVVVVGFEKGSQAELLSEPLDQAGLTSPHVACHGDDFCFVRQGSFSRWVGTASSKRRVFCRSCSC